MAEIAQKEKLAECVNGCGKKIRTAYMDDHTQNGCGIRQIMCFSKSGNLNCYRNPSIHLAHQYNDHLTSGHKLPDNLQEIGFNQYLGNIVSIPIESDTPSILITSKQTPLDKEPHFDIVKFDGQYFYKFSQREEYNKIYYWFCVTGSVDLASRYTVQLSLPKELTPVPNQPSDSWTIASCNENRLTYPFKVAPLCLTECYLSIHRLDREIEGYLKCFEQFFIQEQIEVLPTSNNNESGDSDVEVQVHGHNPVWKDVFTISKFGLQLQV